MVPTDFGWSDIGAGPPSGSSAPRIRRERTARRCGAEDSQNSYLRADGPLVAALGVDDLIVVATAGCGLVSAKDRDQDVKSWWSG